MLGEFKVLHVNLGKRKTAHWSLFCGESLASFDFFIIIIILHSSYIAYGTSAIFSTTSMTSKYAPAPIF
jgi:hypothetical protein